jgi:hypothetical protein
MVPSEPDSKGNEGLTARRRLAAATTLAAVALAPPLAAGRAEAGTQTASVSSVSLAHWSHAVTRICAHALLFEGRHEIGTLAGAIAVSRDIRSSTRRRLAKVAHLLQLQHLGSTIESHACSAGFCTPPTGSTGPRHGSGHDWTYPTAPAALHDRSPAGRSRPTALIIGVRGSLDGQPSVLSRLARSPGDPRRTARNVLTLRLRHTCTSREVKKRLLRSKNPR